MEPTSTSAIAAVAAAVIAALSKKIIDRFLDRSGREFIVKDETGKTRSFELKEGVSSRQAAKAIRRELALERSVEAMLNTYLQGIGRNEARIGRYVDFVADLGHEKIALEVKSSASRLKIEALKKYLKDEPNLSRLVLLTSEPVSAKVKEQSRALVKEGKLSFVVIANDQSPQFQLQQIANALTAAGKHA